ncbi:hypothetical protein HMI51_16635 [Corallococcus coralloides]|nr:hypothetical protein [Corallococcus coralloides]
MTYRDIKKLVAHMVGTLGEGHARHAFRQSIINDMQLHGGFSAVGAEQVVDQLERHEIKKMKKA